MSQPKPSAVARLQQYQSNSLINYVLGGVIACTSYDPAAPMQLTLERQVAGALVPDGRLTARRAHAIVRALRTLAQPMRQLGAPNHTLWRGTRMAQPVLLHTHHQACPTMGVTMMTDDDILYMSRQRGAPMKLVHPLSCTTSKQVAADFARGTRSPGFVHRLHVAPDVQVIDVNQVLAQSHQTNLTAREKEIIILPAAHTASPQRSVWLTPEQVRGNVIAWRVTVGLLASR